jgi:hypothetical protein
MTDHKTIEQLNLPLLRTGAGSEVWHERMCYAYSGLYYVRAQVLDFQCCEWSSRQGWTICLKDAHVRWEPSVEVLQTSQDAKVLEAQYQELEKHFLASIPLLVVEAWLIERYNKGFQDGENSVQSALRAIINAAPLEPR